MGNLSSASGEFSQFLDHFSGQLDLAAKAIPNSVPEELKNLFSENADFWDSLVSAVMRDEYSEEQRHEIAEVLTTRVKAFQVPFQKRFIKVMSENESTPELLVEEIQTKMNIAF